MRKATKKIDTELARYTLLNTGVVTVKYHPGIDINIEVARQVVVDRKAFVEGKASPILSDIRGMKFAGDPKTRAYFQSKEAREGVLAGAMLVDSVFTSYLANLFLRVSYKKQSFPVKVFNDEHAALEWLEQYAL